MKNDRHSIQLDILFVLFIVFSHISSIVSVPVIEANMQFAIGSTMPILQSTEHGEDVTKLQIPTVETILRSGFKRELSDFCFLQKSYCSRRYTPLTVKANKNHMHCAHTSVHLVYVVYVMPMPIRAQQIFATMIVGKFLLSSFYHQLKFIHR